MRPSVQQPIWISTDKNVMARARKNYLKNNYLTLRSKVKVPQKSLQYVTHHLMVMHPHTKYHWPILKDKNVMAQENTIQKTIIWPWGQRSRSHKSHSGMWHTALWSCSHIPNIIELSGKTKKLWSGQASLRRNGIRRSGGGRSGGGRKNQTQNNMSPFVRRGDITTIYEVGNPCHGLVQTHSCGRVYSVSRLSRNNTI
jgi:hypothetical protein